MRKEIKELETLTKEFEERTKKDAKIYKFGRFIKAILQEIIMVFLFFFVIVSVLEKTSALIPAIIVLALILLLQEIETMRIDDLDIKPTLNAMIIKIQAEKINELQNDVNRLLENEQKTEIEEKKNEN